MKTVREFTLKAIMSIAFLVPLLVAGQDEIYYNNLAYKEYQNKNYSKCIEYCNQSLTIKPNGWAYYERASAKYSLLDYPGALNDYTLALVYYKDAYGTDDIKTAAEAYYWKGMSNIKLKNYQSAISDFNNAQEKGYSNKDLLYWDLGIAYDGNRDYKKAIECYDKAIGLSKESKNLSKLYENRGLCHHALFNLEEALDDYNKAIEKDEYHASIYYSRALVKYDLFDYKGAITDMDKAIDYFGKGYLSGNDRFTLNELYYERGLYKYYAKDYSPAISDFNKSIELNSQYGYAYWYRGLAFERIRDYSKSLESYDAAIPLVSTDKEKAILYRNKAIIGKYLLQYRSAIADCENALKYNPNYKNAIWDMAILQGRVKNYPESLNYYEGAISAYVSDSASLSTLYKERARIRIKMKDNPGAISDFKTAILYNDQNQYAYYDLGRLYKEGLNNNAMAKIYLEKAAAISLDEKEVSVKATTYAYAKVIGGDTKAAISKMSSIIEKYQEDKYEYPWQLYNMACIYALGKNTGKAIEYLDKALEAGFYDHDHLQNDIDLDILRNLPAFKALLVKYKIPAVK